MKVVRFGEEWLLGNVGQRWDISGAGLIYQEYTRGEDRSIR